MTAFSKLVYFLQFNDKIFKEAGQQMRVRPHTEKHRNQLGGHVYGGRRMDPDSKLAAGWRSNWKLGLGQGNLGAHACHPRGRRSSENE